MDFLSQLPPIVTTSVGPITEPKVQALKRWYQDEIKQFCHILHRFGQSVSAFAKPQKTTGHDA